MAGMATLVTLLSRYVMKVARLTATSVHHRRDIGTASFLVLGPPRATGLYS